jgi:hypothetical protein
MDLGVALKTHRDGVVYVVEAFLSSRHNMVAFHLGATEAVADAATPMAPRQKPGDVRFRKGHSVSVSFKPPA